MSNVKPATTRLQQNELKHGNIFHFLRLFFAVLVIFSHSFAALGLPEPGFLGRTFGSIAVMGFFSLSGYLIVGSWNRNKQVIPYIRARFVRIVPGLVVALTISYLPWALFNHYNTNPVPYIVNGPVWTIPYEIICYGLVLLFGVLGLTDKLSSYAAIFLPLAIAHLIDSNYISEFNVVILPMFMSFLTGGLIYLISRGRLLSKAVVVVSGMILVVISNEFLFNMMLQLQGTFFPLAFQPGLTLVWFQKIAISFVFPLFVIAVGQQRLPAMMLKNDYSYGLYLYGWPIGQSIIYTFHNSNEYLRLNAYVLFILTLLISFAAAWISWHVIEKRALNFK